METDAPGTSEAAEAQTAMVPPAHPELGAWLGPPRWRLKRVETPEITVEAQEDSGMAALAVMLAYHGIDVPVRELAKDCDRPGGRSSPGAILGAAREFDLEARVFRCDASALIRRPGPFIALLKRRRYIVVEACGRRAVQFNEPGQGRGRMTAQAFRRPK